MNLRELKIWLSAFRPDPQEPLSPLQWARIHRHIVESEDQKTTEIEFINRYWAPYLNFPVPSEFDTGRFFTLLGEVDRASIG